MKPGKKEVIIGEQFDHAAEVILRVIGLERQGFILPPCEVKELLGISGEDVQWHLHHKIDRLRRVLAKEYILMDVHPREGITIMCSQPSDGLRIRCSPRTIRN